MQFYKPNSKNSGHAVGFSFNSKDGALYVEFVKQTSWDAELKRGAFKGGAKFNIKLNDIEIGSILNCIERGKAAKLFHQAEKGSTSIALDTFPLVKDGEAARARDGFTISVNPRSTGEGDVPQKFGFWFNSAEERVLKEYLQFVLEKFFSAEYSAEKQRRDAAYKKRQAENGENSVEKGEKVEEGDPFA